MTVAELTYSHPPVKELQLDGGCGYRIDNGRVVINVGRILSLRETDNLSGTLSIELWALADTYNGEGFNGTALAGTCIGELQGQHMLVNCEYDLIFQPPAAGLWHLCLMLREWNGVFFETVDYVNFDQIYREPAELQLVTPKPAAEVVRLEAAVVPPVKLTISEDAPQKPAKKRSSASPRAKVKAEKTDKAEKAEEAPLSVNTASAKKLAKVKGISEKLAEAIIAGRPYASLDELKKVKGIGHKTLEKIQAHISL